MAERRTTDDLAQCVGKDYDQCFMSRAFNEGVIDDFGFAILTEEEQGVWMGALHSFFEELIRKKGEATFGAARWYRITCTDEDDFNARYPPIEKAAIDEIHAARFPPGGANGPESFLSLMGRTLKVSGYWEICVERGIVHNALSSMRIARATRAAMAAEQPPAAAAAQSK